MKRQKRTRDPDKLSLDNYTTEDIEPVNVSPNKEGFSIRNTSQSLYHEDSIKNWIDETYRRTKNTGKEHGFYIDWYGNVIGIFEGDKTSVTWPNDAHSNRVLMLHSHPRETPVFSESDMRIFESMHETLGIQCLLSVPEGGKGPGLFTLAKVDKDDTRGINTGPDLVDKWSKNGTDRIHGESNRVLNSLEVVNKISLHMDSLSNIYSEIRHMESTSEQTLKYSYTPILKSKIS